MPEQQIPDNGTHNTQPAGNPATDRLSREDRLRFPISQREKDRLVSLIERAKRRIDSPWVRLEQRDNLLRYLRYLEAAQALTEGGQSRTQSNLAAGWVAVLLREYTLAAPTHPGGLMDMPQPPECSTESWPTATPVAVPPT